MKKKEINELLKDKKIKKLVKEFKKEIKRHNKVINEQKKQFHKTIEKAQKIREKFEKQTYSHGCSLIEKNLILCLLLFFVC